ncbi:hypothetical protein Tsubulata_034612, partial [Turnera subulata]
RKPCDDGDDRGPLLQSEPDVAHQSHNNIQRESSSSMQTYEHPVSDKETTTDPSKCEQENEVHDLGEEVRTGAQVFRQDNFGRERLKKHRIEVAGRVWIPDIWGQEELLKDWIDCSAFDATLQAGGIMSARAALVEEGKRSNSSVLRIGNRGCRPATEGQSLSG